MSYAEQRIIHLRMATHAENERLARPTHLRRLGAMALGAAAITWFSKALFAGQHIATLDHGGGIFSRMQETMTHAYDATTSVLVVAGLTALAGVLIPNRSAVADPEAVHIPEALRPEPPTPSADELEAAFLDSGTDLPSSSLRGGVVEIGPDSNKPGATLYGGTVYQQQRMLRVDPWLEYAHELTPVA